MGFWYLDIFVNKEEITPIANGSQKANQKANSETVATSPTPNATPALVREATNVYRCMELDQKDLLCKIKLIKGLYLMK